MSAYGFLDRLLHRLALQATPIAELSFDIDQKLVRTDPREIVGERHVFVSGLARAGTTVLMRRFHATGLYGSLTYRDMPFVLAPNFWRRLSAASRRDMAKAERAHGDRILVDFDSPESLDEVFWRVFAGAEYITKTHLRPHAPDDSLVWQYVRYVNAVLASREPPATHYLSKNNNNVLRLAAIRQAFPAALILIPFREPLAHAGSLLRQHRNFSAIQAEDGFARPYMTWLAHHEFGLDHLPFHFGGGAFVPSARDPGTLDYWLERWRDAYGWLERSVPADAVFVCYEDLCADAGVWARLAALAGLPAGEAGEPFVASEAATDVRPDVALAGEAAGIYARLREKAQQGLA